MSFYLEGKVTEWSLFSKDIKGPDGLLDSDYTMVSGTMNFRYREYYKSLRLDR